MPAFSLPSTRRHLTVALQRFWERSPTKALEGAFRSIGGVLSPVYFPCGSPRPVICYELFKGWLLLSQPPGCLGAPTSFNT